MTGHRVDSIRIECDLLIEALGVGGRGGGWGVVCHWSSDQGSAHGQLLPADRRTDTRRPAAAAAATATEEKELENATRGNVASSPIFKGKANHRLPFSLLFFSLFLSFSRYFSPVLSFFPLEPKLRHQSPQFHVSQNLSLQWIHQQLITLNRPNMQISTQLYP